MGKSEFLEAVKAHGGYVTPGMVAHHLGYCTDGTLDTILKHGMTPDIQSAGSAYLAFDEDEIADWQDSVILARRVLGAASKLAVSTKPKGFSATYRRWKAIVSKDVLTNTEVTYLGHRLGETLGGGHARTKMTPDEGLDLHLHVEWRRAKYQGYKLTHEQIEKGVKWLSRRDVLKELREYPYGSVSNEKLVEIASTVHDFTFVGYDTIETGSYYRSTEYKPMYKAISEAGSFVYRASPWVDGSGTRLEVY